MPFPGSQVAEWPVLAVRLSGLAYTDVRLKDMGIAGAGSDRVDASGLHRTVIEDHEGGSAVLIHEAGVKILCLDRERNALPVLMKG